MCFQSCCCLRNVGRLKHLKLFSLRVSPPALSAIRPSRHVLHFHMITHVQLEIGQPRSNRPPHARTIGPPLARSFGRSCGKFGTMVGPCGDNFGAMLAPFGCHVGPILGAFFGSSWDHFGVTWGHFWAMRCLLGASFKRRGARMGGSKLVPPNFGPKVPPGRHF